MNKIKIKADKDKTLASQYQSVIKICFEKNINSETNWKSAWAEMSEEAKELEKERDEEISERKRKASYTKFRYMPGKQKITSQEGSQGRTFDDIRSEYRRKYFGV